MMRRSPSPGTIVKQLRTAGTHTIWIWLWLIAGTAAVSLAATLAALRTGWPPVMVPRVSVEPIPDTLWSAAWSELARTPADTQAGAVHTIVTTIASLAAASFALALLNILALLAVRRLRGRRSDAIRVALGATRTTLLGARWRENRRDIGVGALIALVASIIALAAVYANWPAGLIEPAQRWPIPALASIMVMLFGLAALNALLASRPPSPAAELAGGSATASRRRVRENASIAIIQIGLAVALSTAAMLLYRNGTVDGERLSFDADGLISADVRFTTPLAPAESAAAYAALLARTDGAADLESGAISSPGTWLGMGTRDRVLYECGPCVLGNMFLPLQMRIVSHHAISPEFFTRLGMTVIQGREFNDDDVIGNERVALVNETFATTAFHRGRAVGKKVQIGGMRGEWFTVVGIVPDIRGNGIGAAHGTMPAVFVPIFQMPPLEATLTARAVTGIESLEQLAALLPQRSNGFVLDDVVLMTDRLARAVAPVRWAGVLLAILGIAALVLSLHGVHASLDAQVRNRRRELAVRAAFGASPGQLAGHIAGRTMRLLAMGIALGFVLSFIAARSLESRIGGIPVLDAAPIIGAAFALVAVAGATAAIRRAARTAPARAVAEN
jgi:hypothetical protein